MSYNKQLIVILFLGIILSTLAYDIVNNQNHIDGFGNPFNFIIKPFNDIINAIKDIIAFLCFMKAWFAWLADSIVCALSKLNPICWIVYLIDGIIAFVYIIALFILKPLGLKGVLDVTSNGVTGLKETWQTITGVRLGWPKFINDMCYSCTIKPMPEFKKKPRSVPVYHNEDEDG